MANERNIDVRIRLKGADQFKSGMKNVNASLGTMNNWLDVAKGILSTDILKAGIRKIIEGLGEAVDESVRFESALAGVAKTTDFSDIGLRNFGNQLVKLSEQIPMSASELAGLAEVAGQLGIAEGDLLSFTEVVAAMGVSTNLSAEQAATSFARMANIFGTASKDYSRMGSVVVDLGNNFATTESEIVDMAQNMSGMAALVGMNEANVMAFATALSSIGIHAEAGGSAMQKLFQLIHNSVQSGGKSLMGFAETANMTSSEFSNLWNSDPAEAAQAFIAGLGKIEQQGGSALEVMRSLGIKEVRLTRSVLGLANAEDLLARAMNTANNAWTENSALAEEAGKRYATTASRMEIAQNKIDNAQITIGDSLTGVVVGAKQTIGDIAADWNEKARDINLAEVVESANAAYVEQNKIIDENTKTARNLVDALSAMGSTENLDIDGQKQYIATMDAIIALVPEANKLWNKETLSIEGGTDAIYRNIDAAQALADTEAKLKRDRESVDAYNIVEQSIQARRTELALAEAELGTIQSDFEDFTKDIDFGNLDVSPSERVSEYRSTLGEAEQTVKILSESISEGEAALAEYAYVVANFEASADGVVSASNDMANAMSGISVEQRTAINGLQYLADELDLTETLLWQTKDALIETIDSAISGFGAIEMPDIGTPDTKIENLDSQLEFLNAYSDAVKKAQELGLSTEIIEQLSSGSEGDYATLASIVSGTEEDVATINAKYAEVAVAKETLAEDLAAATIDLTGRVETITTLAQDLVDGVDVGSDMYAKGANDIQNLIDGINSKVSSLASAAISVKKITSSMTSGVEVNADGSHAAGLAYVPSDGYLAQLHRGEMVLTALEAKAYRAEQFANYAMPNALARHQSGGGNTYANTQNTSVNFGSVVVRDDSDTRKIAENIARLNKRRANGRGYY